MKKFLISKVLFTLLCIIVLSILFFNYKVNATTDEQDNAILQDDIVQIDEQEIKIHEEEEKIIKYDVETGEYSEVDMDALIEKNQLFKATRKNTIGATEPCIPNTLQDIETHKSLPMRMPNPNSSFHVIEDTNEYPYKFICRIWATDTENESEHYIGTGFLVGPSMMLTAAHCVYDTHENKINNKFKLEIYPAYSYGYKMFEGKVLQCSSKKIYSSETWNKYHYDDFDWALVELSESFGNRYGYYGIVDYNNNGLLENLNVKMVGYPQKIKSGEDQYYLNGKIQEYYPRYFMTSNGCPEGMSGGPISPDLEEWKYYTIGLIKGTKDHLLFDQTYGVRITQNMINIVINNISSIQ